VQSLPGQCLKDTARARTKPTRTGFKSSTVSCISKKRAADMRHMHTDLMGAPGFKYASYQRNDILIPIRARK